MSLLKLSPARLIAQLGVKLHQYQPHPAEVSEEQVASIRKVCTQTGEVQLPVIMTTIMIMKRIRMSMKAEGTAFCPLKLRRRCQGIDNAFNDDGDAESDK